MNLKVYGGLTFQRIKGKIEQVETIVAASNQTRAAKFMGTTLYEFRKEAREMLLSFVADVAPKLLEQRLKSIGFDEGILMKYVDEAVKKQLGEALGRARG